LSLRLLVFVCINPMRGKERQVSWALRVAGAILTNICVGAGTLGGGPQAEASGHAGRQQRGVLNLVKLTLSVDVAVNGTIGYLNDGRLTGRIWDAGELNQRTIRGF